ncbi:hypothetical protein PFZ55_45250 [Streptomyces sp. MS2A]|nr:hypothetical protein [Streptomyces sp. MS2A]
MRAAITVTTSAARFPTAAPRQALRVIETESEGILADFFDDRLNADDAE